MPTDNVKNEKREARERPDYVPPKLDTAKDLAGFGPFEPMVDEATMGYSGESPSI